MIFLPGSPQPYAHKPKPVRGLSDSRASAYSDGSMLSQSRRGVYEGAAARLEHAMGLSPHDDPAAMAMRDSTGRSSSAWAASPGALQPPHSYPGVSGHGSYGGAFSTPGRGGPSPHGVLVPYGVLRAPRPSAGGSKRRAKSSGGSVQRPSQAQAAQRAYAHIGDPKRKSPPPRGLGGPRARFPANFPQRVADGSTDNAQVLTLSSEPVDLEERMAGPTFSASLPHSEVSVPAYQVSLCTRYCHYQYCMVYGV